MCRKNVCLFILLSFVPFAAVTPFSALRAAQEVTLDCKPEMREPKKIRKCFCTDDPEKNYRDAMAWKEKRIIKNERWREMRANAFNQVVEHANARRLTAIRMASLLPIVESAADQAVAECAAQSDRLGLQRCLHALEDFESVLWETTFSYRTTKLERDACYLAGSLNSASQLEAVQLQLVGSLHHVQEEISRLQGRLGAPMESDAATFCETAARRAKGILSLSTHEISLHARAADLASLDRANEDVDALLAVAKRVPRCASLTSMSPALLDVRRQLAKAGSYAGSESNRERVKLAKEKCFQVQAQHRPPELTTCQFKRATSELVDTLWSLP